MSALTLYHLENCSTCREARKWLAQRGVAVRERAIRETPPTLDELHAMLAAQGGDVRRLFNSSGQEYRALGLAAKLPRLSAGEALALLAGNGRLVKRPFLIGSGVALVGFSPDAWAAALDRAVSPKKA